MNLCPCILNGRASFLSSERVAGSHSRRGLNNIFLEDCFLLIVCGVRPTPSWRIVVFCAKGIVNCEG